MSIRGAWSVEYVEGLLTLDLYGPPKKALLSRFRKWLKRYGEDQWIEGYNQCTVDTLQMQSNS